ncbi:hypothetical protein GGU10DRAFT_365325 [Lentinula aff. detonsa]|uniref:EF-hand domain-containing protein n=1 Tax=Lentinula aff. detonsa TaxID=2804958 RepID=A0AA38KXD5_9AGAR|nr:hypothetical protein GGU10DRAFT_365325 [Lentinula aff. detonsa]
MDHDQAFFALPQYLQRRIDSAYFSAVKHAHVTNSHRDAGTLRSSSVEPPPKRRKTSVHELSADSGGGFIVEDPSDVATTESTTVGGGGFILNDPDSTVAASGGGEGGHIIDGEMPISTGDGFIREVNEVNGNSALQSTSEILPPWIPFSSIPTALQLLDLPPDDEQVLGIFRNAASGWDNRDRIDDNLEVTQADWRAVCTILLEPRSGAGDDNIEVENQIRPGDLEEDDEYVQDLSEVDLDLNSDDGADSDDNYDPGPSSTSKFKTKSSRRPARTELVGSMSGGQRRTRVSRLRSDGSDFDPFDEEGSSSGTGRLTSRQKATCIEAFGLFFPDAKDDLGQRRLMLSDIQRVTKLLGEKLKAEEMLEMLEVFSTAPDRSMGLQDFERMMIAAKLA